MKIILICFRCSYNSLPHINGLSNRSVDQGCSSVVEYMPRMGGGSGFHPKTKQISKKKHAFVVLEPRSLKSRSWQGYTFSRGFCEGESALLPAVDSLTCGCISWDCLHGTLHPPLYANAKIPPSPYQNSWDGISGPVVFYRLISSFQDP